MRFRVIGSSRETGARMTLEFDAQSKAAAERKAQLHGMAVNRVEVLGELEEERPTRVVRSSGNGRMIRIIVLLALAAAAYYYLRSRGMLL
jgi:hypothetical protein